MDFAKINELANMFESKHAWVFGKGPGLDAFDQSKINGPVFCINESLLRVDRPKFFFAHDEVPIERVASSWPTGCCAILQQPRADFALSKGIPADQIRVYEKRQCAAREDAWDRSEIAKTNSLIGLSGTVHTAIHFCHLVGINKITMVGFEGQGEYAASLKMTIPIGGGGHGKIRKESERLLNQLQFEFEFFTSSKVSVE